MDPFLIHLGQGERAWLLLLCSSAGPVTSLVEMNGRDDLEEEKKSVPVSLTRAFFGGGEGENSFLVKDCPFL